MGIRINSAIAYGVQFTDKESRLYDNFIKDKPNHFLLMKWVEKALKYDDKRYSCYPAYNFIQFDKSHRPLKPLRPFWAGMSAKALEKAYIPDLAEENLKKHGRESEAQGLSRFTIWEPGKDTEFQPRSILAIIQERNYAREVDYGLVDFFNMGMENKVIPLKGRYPWECGTTLLKKGKWHTHNGENMIPNLPKEVLTEVLYHTGTQKSFIKKKKEIWDKYHGDLKPYPTFSGDGWHGADFYFHPVDILFQVVAELIPGIKYDIMRLEKMLCFYWS